MTYPTHLLPTTVVGSTPQPDWLVNRAALEKHGVPRTHAQDIWRIPGELLEQARDDGTILASTSLDGTIRVWDTRSRQTLKTLKRHRKTYTGLTVGFDIFGFLGLAGSNEAKLGSGPGLGSGTVAASKGKAAAFPQLQKHARLDASGSDASSLPLSLCVKRKAATGPAWMR